MKRAILGLIVAGFAGMGVAHAQEAGDPAAGKRVFARCLACHKVGPGAAHGVGPELNGIMGEQAGTREGYDFSEAMKAAGAAGLTWTADQLAEFIRNPQTKVPGTKMAFPGIPNEGDVNNLIAYLASFDAEGNSAQ